MICEYCCAEEGHRCHVANGEIALLRTALANVAGHDGPNECIAYLRRQIDPRDSLNPKYALLHQQIDTIQRAIGEFMAAQQTVYMFTNHPEVEL